MKIAVPEYRGRIAPTFDAGRMVVVYGVSSGPVERLAEWDWSDLPWYSRAIELDRNHVDVLLCGGISHWLARQVTGLGIRLVPWVSGEVGKVLDAFLAGGLPHPDLAMPGHGCRCGAHRRRYRGGRHR
ncbi:hypothetical protein JW905_10215 [bacterium]|nr:hypothetical protein [candidate division CSSED10-310 bacterium]